MSASTSRREFAARHRKSCSPWGPLTRKRMAATVTSYLALLSGGWLVVLSTARSDVQALALGLIMPGAGFLAWPSPSGPAQYWALSLCAIALTLFALSIVVWFATGNVLAPIAIWSGSALLAFEGRSLGLGSAGSEGWSLAAGLVPPVVLAVLITAVAVVARNATAGLVRRREREARISLGLPAPEPAQPPDEISLDDLRLMRLLLDRALQPVDRFDGFEWRDQFQTAAVRYQINFASYALAMAGHVHLPAFDGYLLDAQRNLAAKQRDYRIWRYWQLESLWGHLRDNRDPIARDNIMFSGFLAAQLTYAGSGSGVRDFHQMGSLAFTLPDGNSFRYSQGEIIDLLVRQYERAPLGLLACEPNWIYPLCNIITATAIRADDAQSGRQNWARIEPAFRHHLESEFLTPAGRFVSFRSGLTGFAPPPVGGALMQALPCVFLNAVMPDLAAQHWSRLRDELLSGDPRRTIWPLDVGNYRRSRAAGFAGVAAAAVEMGDSEVANRMFDCLAHDHPSQTVAGASHRANASLWAHAVEVMARVGRAGALRSLVTQPHGADRTGLFIKSADYCDLLVAKAREHNGALQAVLYPGDAATGFGGITLAGLVPHRAYVATLGRSYDFTADGQGEACLTLPVTGRTPLHIHPQT
ncbi:MAG: hypothetical protein ABL901_02510 [Hyphomicrobiaceae bacterium]